MLRPGLAGAAWPPGTVGAGAGWPARGRLLSEDDRAHAACGDGGKREAMEGAHRLHCTSARRRKTREKAWLPAAAGARRSRTSGPRTGDVYSCLSATAASMPAARRAAPSVARPTTTIRMTTVTASVHGSVGLIPNSIVPRNCDSTQRTDQADGDPHGGEACALSEDHCQDAADGRAERDAHADLVPPLTHGVGDDAVQAERRQQHRHQRKGVDQARREAARCELRGDELFAAAHGVDRQVRIDRLHGLLHHRGGRRRIPAARHDRQPQRRQLQQRLIDLRADRGVDAVLLHVGDDADDGDPRRVGGDLAAAVDEVEAPPERILATEVGLRERLVDDRRARRARRRPVPRAAGPAAAARRAPENSPE